MNEGTPNSTDNCSTEKKCCVQKFLLTGVVTFAITMLYDWLVHGKLLMDQYNATASLWRPSVGRLTLRHRRAG